jgi:ribosomal protein L29
MNKKIRDFRQKSKTELEKLLSAKQNRFLSVRFDLSGGRAKSIKEVRELKKDIATILTLLGQ